MSQRSQHLYQTSPEYRSRVRTSQAWRYKNDPLFRESICQRSKAARIRKAAERAAAHDPDAYRLERRARDAARCREYQARKVFAAPLWANRAAIQQVYAAAQLLSRLTNLVFEVDHVVPLNSPLVCGLHCEANLNIVLRTVNRRKSNRFWPDMPE